MVKQTVAKLLHLKKVLNSSSLSLLKVNFVLSLMAFLVVQTGSVANADSEVPQTFTLDGKLFRSGSTSSLLDSSIKITVQIIDPTGQCLLYEEEQTVNTSASDGYFHINVGSLTGSAKRTVNDPGRTMAQIFQNLAAISANNVPGMTCAGASYTPTAGAVRYFRLKVTPSTTNVADVLSPDIVIDSVPMAIVAQNLQGLERGSILQVNNSGSTVLTQSNLDALFTTPAYTNLQSILAGNFMTIDSSGASLPSYAANPAGVANGDIWFDTLTNEVKYKNAAGVQIVGTSSGGISSLTVGSSMSINGFVAGTISSSGTLDLSNTGVSAGTYTKMTVDAKGRVTAGTISLVEGDIPNLTAAGKVSGNTITSGTISGSAAINTSGNLISTGTVSGLTVQATNLRIYNGANYIQMTAPVLAGIVNFTLPDNDGDANQVLTTNGSGVLTWAAGTTTLAGDVSGPSGTTSVDKIKGKAITAGSISGQIMLYDGTAWVNSIMSGDATLAHDGMLTLNKVPVSKGGTNAITFGSNKIISSNGTGSTLQDFSCSINQVITFDVSGYAVCASVSSLSAMILNGGNTTAADISIGTNDNKALKFKVNNTIAMTISQSGYVGIGTLSPNGKLAVSRSGFTGNGSSDQNYNILGNVTSDSPSDNWDSTYAVAGIISHTSTQSTSNVAGIHGKATATVGIVESLSGGDFRAYLAGTASGDASAVHLTANRSSTSSNAFMIGVNSITSNSSASGTLTNLMGQNLTTTSGTGTVANLYGIKNLISASGGSVGNAYGEYISFGPVGIATNAYGLYITQITGVNKWSIFANDISAPSYFAGKIGVGISTPTEKVEVVGNLKVSGGQAYVATQISSAASPLTMDADLGNSMVWSTGATASPVVNINNMKAGGSYLVVVQGTGTGSVALNCFSDAGITPLPSSFAPANGVRVAGTLNKTIYNLTSDGTNCLITWVSGF